MAWRGFLVKVPGPLQPAWHSFLPWSLLPWKLLSALGRRRRQSGQYNRHTLLCLYLAARKHPSPLNLFHYLRFRRDLGRRPSARLTRALLSQSDSLPEPMRELAGGWLLEHEEHKRAKEATTRPSDSMSIPDELQQLRLSQPHLRDAFAAYLLKHRGSICVVGNGPLGTHSDLARRIDRHRVVIRFNAFWETQRPSAAPGQSGIESSTGGSPRGSRLDVWVRSPGHAADASSATGDPQWFILTGPDVRFHLLYGQEVLSRVVPGKTLTVPLRTWRRLVEVLEAPPSAGLLVLAWLKELLGDWDGLNATGFQILGAKSKASARRGGLRRTRDRHHWQAEARVLQQWRREGLRFLE